MLWCKCELKTEAIIIALIFLIASSIFTITYLSMATVVINEDNATINEYQSDNEEIQIGVFFSALSCITDVLLLYGTIKENRYYFIPWLAFYGIALFVGNVQLLDTSESALLTFIEFIFVEFLIYPWYTILKYFKILDPHNPNRPPQTVVYTPVGFSNDNGKAASVPLPPPTGIVVYTPGLPAHNDIVAQPQNV